MLLRNKILCSVHTCELNRSQAKYAYVWIGLRICVAPSANGSHTIRHKLKFVAFYAWTQREWVLCVLFLSQVCEKLIYYMPSANCLVRMCVLAFTKPSANLLEEVLEMNKHCHIQQLNVWSNLLKLIFAWKMHCVAGDQWWGWKRRGKKCINKLLPHWYIYLLSAVLLSAVRMCIACWKINKKKKKDFQEIFF